MTDLPDRIRIPRHALAAWSRVRDRLHESIDGRRLPGDEGPITDARMAAEMIALCEAALGLGPGIILDPMQHPVYEVPPPDGEPIRPPPDPAFAERLDRIERHLGIATPNPADGND